MSEKWLAQICTIQPVKVCCQRGLRSQWTGNKRTDDPWLIGKWHHHSSDLCRCPRGSIICLAGWIVMSFRHNDFNYALQRVVITSQSQCTGQRELNATVVVITWPGRSVEQYTGITRAMLIHTCVLIGLAQQTETSDNEGGWRWDKMGCVHGAVLGMAEDRTWQQQW